MKPFHLSKSYGDQFQDRSLVEHYRKRPAYPAARFDLLVASLPENAHIVDLGCGTGVISIPLAERGMQVTGDDPSVAIIELAKFRRQRVSVHQRCRVNDAVY